MINVAGFVKGITNRIKGLVSDEDIVRVRRDKEQEVWDFGGKYNLFIKRKINNITSRVQIQSNSQIDERIRQDVLKNIAWSVTDPKHRSRMIRKLIDELYKDLFEGDMKNRLKIRRRKIKKRKVKRLKRKNTPNPNPKPGKEKEKERDEETFVPMEPPRSTPPPAVTYPIESKKNKFSSRVGYFVSISDLYYYTQEESILDEKRIVFKFDEQPGGVLSLEEGEEWYSPWQDAGVIRAVDINVHGQTKLNYFKNPTFEL